MAVSHQDYLSVDISADDIDTIVGTIRIVVHTEGQRGSTLGSNNHATQYLILDDGRSVQINMRHDETDLNGTLVIKSRSYVSSRSEIIHFDYDTVTPVSVRSVLTRILGGRFSDFCFSGGGMGCKYWQVIVVQQHESVGWLARGSAALAHGNLSFDYSRLRSPVVAPMVAGTFDQQSTRQIAETAFRTIAADVERNMATLTAALSTHPAQEDLIRTRLGELMQQQQGVSAMTASLQLLYAQRDEQEEDDEE